MNKKPLTLGIIILIFLAVAITATGGLFLFPYSPVHPPLLLDRNSTPSGIQEVVDANNQFAFDFFSAIDNDKNIFYSPYSISTALAMTYEGARGKTADEMKQVFHFPRNMHENFPAIYNNLNRRNKKYELRTGNALWVQKDYPLLEDYLSTVEKYYGGKAANVDFIRETEKSRQTINTFIEKQTNHKIKDLISEDAIEDTTKLVLTNAIYFKGKWLWEFDKSKTTKQDFKITPTNIVKTPMMHMLPKEASFNYLDNGKLQILELPYKGENISMLIILPKDNLDSIRLNYGNLKKWKTQMYETHLDAISIPKFKFDTGYFLKETLISMGMPTAFSNEADFSGMNGIKDDALALHISQVIHQAYINVDEKGTEAAAATAVIMQKIVAVREQKIFNADHPFIFIIQERKTGEILFMGKIVNPTDLD